MFKRDEILAALLILLQLLMLRCQIEYVKEDFCAVRFSSSHEDFPKDFCPK